MDTPIQVLVADDHAIVREGLRALLFSEPGLEQVGEAKDGAEAVSMAHTLKPDVILMDLVMPRLDGVEAIIQIKQDDPEAKILVLTNYAEDAKVFAAIKAGALGYLLKDSSPKDLLNGIREVHRGEPSLHPMIARKLMGELTRPADALQAAEALTDREEEVLKLVAQGLSNREIGDRLVISERTVRTHVSNILMKLHLANRTQAALHALREGLVSLDS